LPVDEMADQIWPGVSYMRRVTGRFFFVSTGSDKLL
jgi:hypothetical protein